MRLLILMILPLWLYAESLDFSLYKKGEGTDENVLLVIGGIQGDEPGGFNAASLLVTNYKITKGNVWVVPNLNFLSIVERSRGEHGDMNRKFAALPLEDPEYGTVERIKSIIRDRRVKMVLNLHDGSGFFREKYIDQWRNPYRWGQSCIIDQATLDGKEYGNLQEIAERVKTHINANLADQEHRFSVKNTKTAEGDAEMAKSLTYYAIREGKPAFGIEGSKNFGTHYRAYYHLLAVEQFMNEMGIEFERNFKMSPLAVKDVIDNSEIKVVLYDNKLLLPVSNARTYLYYIPLKKDSNVEYKTDHPLVAVVERENAYRVCYGNRRMALLYPEYFEYDNSIQTIDMQIDGFDKVIPLGSVVNVGEKFMVKNRDGYRVNVIGYSQDGFDSEGDFEITKENIPDRFSIDNDGKIFRVEVYKEDKFSGMVLVNFDSKVINPIHAVAEADQNVLEQ